MSGDQEIRIAALEARIGSALSWIERHEDKWGSITIELSCIKDSLLGIRCTDATCGAANSDRFAAGLVDLPVPLGNPRSQP